MESWKEKITRHGLSALITFASTFLLTFLSLLSEALENPSLIGTHLFFALLSGATLAGVRALVKALYEALAKDLTITSIKKK